jgi:ankyrin repeat protein
MKLGSIVLFAAAVLIGMSPAVSGPLHDAVKDSDLVRLQELIEAGEDLNAQDNFVGTALHWVALKNDIEAARLLIAAGADVNLPRIRDTETANKQGITPLMNAASVDAVDMIDLFVAEGADIDAKRGSGLTALHIAVYSGSTGAVRKLVALGIDLNGAPDTEPVAFATPLAETIYHGQIGKLKPDVADEIATILREAGASE